MSTAPEEFYSAERWQNWLNRIQDEEIDPEDENSARLLLNLQDDAAIAVVKILTAFQEDELTEEQTLEELTEVRDIVLREVDIEDEDTAILIDSVQTSLVCVFLAAEEYVIDGVDSATIEDRLTAAAEAEADERLEDALVNCAHAGTSIIDGTTLDMSLVADLEYGLVAEWVNGLDSLSNALSDPEVVEE